LWKKRQYNINIVAAPDFTNLVYSEVYFYPDPRVTASALYIIPLDPGLSKVDAILSISTKDKNQIPIIETDYANLYPFKFNTFTPVDWNKNSDKILFKEKLGQHYDQIFLTKLYLYDLSTGKIQDLNIVRTKIVEYWATQGIYLADLKWDIKPLGFLEASQERIGVIAYGYQKKERKFLGFWVVDIYGNKVYKTDFSENELPEISANGKCLKFIPEINEIFDAQRRYDVRHKNTRYIEPK